MAIDPRAIEVAEADHGLHAHLRRHEGGVHRRPLVGEGEHAHPSHGRTAARPRSGMGTQPNFTVEYIEPVAIDAEPLPDEFSASRLRRGLLFLTLIAVVVAALIVLIPGLASLRDRFSGARPGWLVLAVGLELASCACYVLVFR